MIYAPAAGTFTAAHKIGDTVRGGEPIGSVLGEDTENGPVPVCAQIDGILRGVLRDGYPVRKGMKAADVDPRREEYKNCFTISDKARCIAGSVLELVCRNMCYDKR